MSVNWARLVNPRTNAGGYITLAGAVYAAVVMISNAANHHGVIDPSVIVALVAAVAGVLSRTVVTPTSDPRTSAGTPLVPAAPAPPKPPG